MIFGNNKHSTLYCNKQGEDFRNCSVGNQFKINNIQSQPIEPDRKPILQVHRFRVFQTNMPLSLEKDRYSKHHNYQVFGEKFEYAELRIYTDYDGKIERVRTYQLPSFDREILDYVAKAVICWFKKKPLLSSNKSDVTNSL